MRILFRACRIIYDNTLPPEKPGEYIFKETLATWYDREKIHSQNLHQLFSYLLNQQSTDCPDSFKTRGILIYPDTGKEIGQNDERIIITGPCR